MKSLCDSHQSPLDSHDEWDTMGYMILADRLRRAYEAAMGVPVLADWEKLAPSWQDTWRAVAREAEVGTLSRRDQFAAAALTGYLADPKLIVLDHFDAERVVEMADAVLKELDKEKP